MIGTKHIWAAAGVTSIAVAVTAVIVLTGGDDTAAPPPPSTSTSSSSSSTTTTTPPSDDAAVAVFPTGSGGARYTDPVAATNAFATQYVGFTDPFVGAFRQGDARSGEVDVQPFADGPITTVFVRRLGPDDAWYVIGSATANITVTQPTPLATITSPVALAGTSTAFEGTVQVQVRADGRAEPLQNGFVTGGANGELGPFTSSLAFPSPGVGAGAVVFFTVSAENGSILEASVVRVRFA